MQYSWSLKSSIEFFPNNEIVKVKISIKLKLRRVSKMIDIVKTTLFVRDEKIHPIEYVL